MLPPRLMNAREVAAYLRRSPSWFRSQRTRLEAEGFPKRLPSMRLWDTAAIDAWLDRIGQRGRLQNVEDPLAGF